LTLITETFEVLTKKCANFDSLLMNIQDVTACSLEKVNSNVYTVVSIEPHLPF